jgi:hypothetical protein
MSTVLQCSNESCRKVENIPEGILAPSSCLACGAPMERVPAEVGITTQPVATLVQPAPDQAGYSLQPVQATDAITDATAPAVDAEPAAEDRPRRRKRPPRISGETGVPMVSIFGYELTMGGLFRVGLPLALLVGGVAFVFWAAGRIVTDTSGNFRPNTGAKGQVERPPDNGQGQRP